MDLFHWERFEPRIGLNHTLPVEQRFFLEVACGLSKVQLKKVKRATDFSKLQLDQAALVEEAKTSKSDDETQAEAIERVTEAAMAAKCTAQLAAEWGPFVRIGSPGHSIGGVPIATLADYLGAVLGQLGKFNVIELSKVLAQLNSVSGTHALFSERLSGGPISTVGPSTEAEDAAARR